MTWFTLFHFHNGEHIFDYIIFILLYKMELNFLVTCHKFARPNADNCQYYSWISEEVSCFDVCVWIFVFGRETILLGFMQWYTIKFSTFLSLIYLDSDFISGSFLFRDLILSCKTVRLPSYTQRTVGTSWMECASRLPVSSNSHFSNCSASYKL